MHARLKNLNIAPRKVRIVADLVRGCSVTQALAILQHTQKAASLPLARLIKSAVANAVDRNEEIDPLALRVRKICVDQGLTMKRFTPRAQGRATPILKRSSHVVVELEEAY